MPESLDAPPPPPPDPPEPPGRRPDAAPPEEAVESVDPADEAEAESPPEDPTPAEGADDGSYTDEALAESPAEDVGPDIADVDEADQLLDEAEQVLPDEDLDSDPDTGPQSTRASEFHDAAPSPDRVEPSQVSDSPVEIRPSIPDRYPDDYEKPSAEDSRRLSEMRNESDDPKDWVDGINPGFDEQKHLPFQELPELNRTTNCCDCARSVQDTLDGRPTVASASDFDGRAGSYRIEEWAGRPSEASTLSAVEEGLPRPGDSALVTVGWKDGEGGHAFNAVNADGEVCYVDGQTGQVEKWPPPFSNDVDEGSVRAWFFARED